VACGDRKFGRIYLRSPPKSLSIKTFHLRTGRPGRPKRYAILTVKESSGLTTHYTVRETWRRGKVVEAYIKRGLIGTPGITGKKGEHHDGHVHWKWKEDKTGKPGFRDDLFGTASALGLDGKAWGQFPKDPGRETLPGDRKRIWPQR
jgi:hypothetical protein